MMINKNIFLYLKHIFFFSLENMLNERTVILHCLLNLSCKIKQWELDPASTLVINSLK